MRLNSVVAHLGTSLNNGHYIAYVRRNNKWYLADDSFITECNIETVLKQNAYILFYEKYTENYPNNNNNNMDYNDFRQQHLNQNQFINQNSLPMLYYTSPSKLMSPNNNSFRSPNSTDSQIYRSPLKRNRDENSLDNNNSFNYNNSNSNIFDSGEKRLKLTTTRLPQKPFTLSTTRYEDAFVRKNYEITANAIEKQTENNENIQNKNDLLSNSLSIKSITKIKPKKSSWFMKAVKVSIVCCTLNFICLIWLL